MNAYKNWQTPLSLPDVFAKPAAPSYLTARDGFVYWMESLAAEGGRTVIKRIAIDGAINGTVNSTVNNTESVVECLTPSGFNVRTKANEYGGKAYVVGADAVYFCNYADQRVYRQPLVMNADARTSAIQPASPSIPLALTDTMGVYFADLSLSHDERFLLFVMETPVPLLPKEATENLTEVAYIAIPEAIQLSDRSLAVDHLAQKPTVLQTGADFYAAISVSDAGLTERGELDVESQQHSLQHPIQKIAWIEWQHPNMPWDATSCHAAELLTVAADSVDALPTLVLQNQQTVINNSNNSANEQATASHPQWLSDGSLLLSIDWPQRPSDAPENFANLYRWHQNKLAALTHGHYEYSYPHWIFGNHRAVAVNDTTLLAIATGSMGDELHLIDWRSGHLQRIANNYCAFNYCCSFAGQSFAGQAFVMAASTTGGSQLLQVNEQGDVLPVSTNELTERSTAPSSREATQLTAVNTSEAEILSIPVVEDSDWQQQTDRSLLDSSETALQPVLEHCYANYYRPQNSEYNNASDVSTAPPPLLVMVHGGPTAQANRSFDIQKQFWTTSGFAILDVNHRGSSGYGRQYRDALLGQWGMVDAQDIRAAIQYAVDEGLADAQNVYIRGKSAGGYAVQRVLTLFPELFAAGASYYGIGDLAALAEITHKFEAYYCDQLLGEAYDAERAKRPDSHYFQRSPVNFMAQITCPMILFQGLEDKVVPPILSQQVADLLKQRGLPYEYHYYANEGHGFRAITTLVDSLQKELAFFRAQMR